MFLYSLLTKIRNIPELPRLVGVLFLISATTWIFAPSLNSNLAVGPNLISEYEAHGIKNAVLFRVGDTISATILLATIFIFRKKLVALYTNKIVLGLAIYSSLIYIDVLSSEHCKQLVEVCAPKHDFIFLIHAIESFVSGITLFIVSFLLYKKIKKYAWMPIMMTLFTIGGLLAYQLSDHATLSLQFSYQIAINFWLYIVVFLNISKPIKHSENMQLLIRRLAGIWLAANGVVAIFSSWDFFTFKNPIGTLLFSNDVTWFVSHSVLVGFALLYLARQVMRGERQALIIVLIILLMEVFKYALIINAELYTLIYLMPLCALLYFSPAFDRHAGFRVKHRLLYIVLVITFTSTLATAASIGYRQNNRGQWEKSAFETSRVIKRVALLEISPDASDPKSARQLAYFLNIVGFCGYLWLLTLLFTPKDIASKECLTDAKSARMLLNRYSDSSEDFFKLWPHDKKYFTTDHGVIAYKRIDGVAFALANPIAPSRHHPAMLRDFSMFAKKYGWNTAWLLVAKQSTDMYKDQNLKILQVGASAVIDIVQFIETTSRNKWWRWQINRGQKQGYSHVVHFPPHSDALLQELSVVSDAWLERAGHQEQGFALGYFDNDYLQDCILHTLALPDKKIIAFANQIPTFAGQKRASIDLMRFASDANGAMPFLVQSIIQYLNNNTHYSEFDLGFVPLAKTNGPIFNLAKQLGSRRFAMSGLAQFKNKFEPLWEENFIAYDGDMLDLGKYLLALEKAMSVTKK